MENRSRRAGLYSVFALMLLFTGCEGEGDQPIRIGIISGLGGTSSSTAIINGFFSAMAERGYTEGNGVVFDLRETSLDDDEQEKAVAELLAGGIDILFAFPTETAVIAKPLTQVSGVPLVFAVSTTEGNNLIDGIETPGNGVTGVRYPTQEVALKRYELMRDIVPGMHRLVLPYDPNDSRTDRQLTSLRMMARKDGIELIEIRATTGEETILRFEERLTDGAPDFDAVLVIVDRLGVVIGPSLEGFCGEHALPFGGYPHTTEVPNTLFSVGIGFNRTGFLAASLVDKIVKGAPAGDLPVLSSEIRIVVNQRRAGELGLEIPETILLAADGIIRE